MATQTWTDILISHLELLNQIASTLPANEELIPDNLNKILELTEGFKSVFLFQMELQGLKPEKQ